jgi:hypothetical protein
VTEEDLKAYEEWVQALPEFARATARSYPTWQCYRSVKSPALHHFKIYSYDYDPNDLTVPISATVMHGSDSSLPGVAVQQYSLSLLVVCGCGGWKGPTDWQVMKMERKLGLQKNKGPRLGDRR